MTQDMTFLKANGMKIRGKMYLPEDGAVQWPIVIFAHGFGGCYRELTHHGDGYAQAGICCLFFDFCGGGIQSLSDGTMSDMTVASECDDLEAVIAQVKELDYIDSQKVYLQGESMGGLIAALTAAKYPKEIAALVLWYPAFILPEDAKKRMQTGDHHVFGLAMSEQFDREAARISVCQQLPNYKRPVLIIHGDQDTVVPITYSRDALAVWPNARLIVMHGAGHGYEGSDSVSARERSIAFITECLSQRRNQHNLSVIEK